jgi:hypothetical protein
MFRAWVLSVCQIIQSSSYMRYTTVIEANRRL